MPTWVAVAGTFVLSAVSAYVFLLLSCRKSGNPFGRRAKWWAMTVIVLSAIVATGVSIAAAAVSDHARAAVLGLVIPSGLLIGQASTQRSLGRASSTLRSVVSCVTFPLRRLYDSMGDDMQEWCDTRRDAAALRTPRRVAEAAQYYHNQVAGRLTDSQAREPLDRWKESIQHKVHVIQLINLDTTPARLQAELERHRSTQDYIRLARDPQRLADRLESDAQNELHLFLAHVYRLGYHNLLIYPMRPSMAARGRRHPAGRS